MSKQLKTIITCTLLLNMLGLFILPAHTRAQNSNDALSAISYPRIANYFLDSYLHPDEAKLLTGWDVLVLSSGAQEWRPEVFQVLREANPDIIILAYVSVSGVANRPSDYERFKDKEAAQIPDEWWLKSTSGEKLGYWPGSHMLNVSDLSPTDENGERWNTWIADWIADNIYATGYWDGIFLDEAFPAVSWVNGGDIDLDGDGSPEDSQTINNAWQNGITTITKNLRNRIGSNAYIMVNGASNYTQFTNGRMQENVLDSPDSWSEMMNTYISTYNASAFSPKLHIINANTNNTGVIDRQRQLFALTSTLLGNGFFSYDYGDEKHMSIWWSDDYDKPLGQPISDAYNTGNLNDKTFKPGLWRRDFSGGTVLVNSSPADLEYLVDRDNKKASGMLEAFSGIIITLDELDSVIKTPAPTRPDPPQPPVKVTQQQPTEIAASESPPKEEDDSNPLGQPLYQDTPPAELFKIETSQSTATTTPPVSSDTTTDTTITPTKVISPENHIEQSGFSQIILFIKKMLSTIWYSITKVFS